MSEIFSEVNMTQTLNRYIPNGETLLAGIHAVSKYTDITAVFGKCALSKDKLVPDADGGTVVLRKKKHSPYDIYIGITQSFLIIADCEKNFYNYKSDDKPNVNEANISPVTEDIPLSDIGTCFPLSDIQSCQIKKGLVGSVNCALTMKGGSSFKLILPKLGGLGNAMPNHAKYREAVINCLSKA